MNSRENAEEEGGILTADKEIKLPVFPAIAVTPWGMLTYGDMDSLSACSYSKAKRGYFDRMLVFDYSGFKWKVANWRLIGKKPGLFNRLWNSTLSPFQLEWNPGGEYDVHELKTVLMDNFPKDDELYSEVSIELEDIAGIEAIEDAMSLFTIPEVSKLRFRKLARPWQPRL